MTYPTDLSDRALSLEIAALNSTLTRDCTSEERAVLAYDANACQCEQARRERLGG